MITVLLEIKKWYSHEMEMSNWIGGRFISIMNMHK